jgi:hypothetical protein
MQTYLVSLVGSGGSSLALLTGSELGKVAMVITLPKSRTLASLPHIHLLETVYDVHLVVEHLALTCLSLGDKTLVKHHENIFADLLELLLDLLAVLADDANVLV